MKAKSLLMASLAVVGMTFTACDEEPGNPGGTTVENVAGEVSGVWEKNSVVKISGHITVPEGKTLVVEEGVKVIFSSNGVGVSHTPIAFIVDGNL